jgi:preprotein translocase subunit YajC
MTSMVEANVFLAQLGAPGQSGGTPWPMMLVFYALILAAMYFLMIAPQRKKQKEHEKMLASISSGDEVLTAGGIFGTITNVKDDRFVVRVGDNQKVEVGKGFIQSVVKKSA